MPSLRRAVWFAVAGLATAFVVGAVYLGYGLYLLQTGQTGWGHRENSEWATARAITREAWATSFPVTEQARATATVIAQARENTLASGRSVPSLDHLTRGSSQCAVTSEVRDPCPTDLYGARRADPKPEVDLAWTAPINSQVTTYKIMRVDNLGTETVVAEIPSEFVEVTDRHLPLAGAQYTYTVIAVNAHGTRAPSVGAVIRNGVPNAPTGLYVSLEPGNEADLEWDAPASSYFTHYRVERKLGINTWVPIVQSIPAEYLTTTDHRLQSGVTYAYRVVAFNEWSESAPSAPFVLHVP